MDLQPSGLDPAHVQQFVDQPREALDLAQQRRQVTGGARDESCRAGHITLEELREAFDRRDRGPQFVRGDGEEFIARTERRALGGDVVDQDDLPQECADFVVDRGGDLADDTRGGANKGVFERVFFFRVVMQIEWEGGGERGLIVEGCGQHGGEFDAWQAEQSARCDAVEVVGAGVGGQHTPLGIAEEYPLLDRGDRRIEPRLVLCETEDHRLKLAEQRVLDRRTDDRPMRVREWHQVDIHQHTPRCDGEGDLVDMPLMPGQRLRQGDVEGGRGGAVRGLDTAHQVRAGAIGVDDLSRPVGELDPLLTMYEEALDRRPVECRRVIAGLCHSPTPPHPLLIFWLADSVPGSGHGRTRS